MPFLILPKSLAVSDELRQRLASRLCPYKASLETVLETPSYDVWATPVARVESGVVSSRLTTGTASFELRVDSGDLRVETDPFGTCPIWYRRSDRGWIVSPEAKAIATVEPVALRPDSELTAPGARPAGWSPYKNLHRLRQGSHLRLAGDEAVREGRVPRFEVDREAAAAKADWVGQLGRVLIASFSPANEPTGSLVSGGIDSSIACALASRTGPVATFTLGTMYGNEFGAARSLAEALECLHREVHLDASQVDAELDRVVFENEVFDGLTAEILLQMSVLYEAARGSCTRITTGYGSDLLFDGMLRHRAYMEAVGLDSTSELIERTRWTGELAPFVHWSRCLAVEHIFWQPEVVRLALQVPRELCFAGGIEKRILRDSAVHAGLLPEALAFRDKKGLSDGTGTNLLLSRALGLESAHAYRAKSAAAIERLKRLFPASSH